MSSSTLSGSASSDVPAPQRRYLRLLALAIVVAQVPVGIGLFLGSDWARDLWPLPDVRMTYIFLASIVASTAMLILWPVVRDDPGALRAAAFNLSTATPPLGLYLLWLAADGEGRDLIAPGVAFVLFGASWIAIWRWVSRIRVQDTRPIPRAIRLVFIGFCVLLIPIGSALLFQMDGIFPWDISPENSTVAGIIFLSAAALFIFILLNPFRVFGEAGLASFLAYDLVLAGPYIDFFRNRDDADTVASYYGGMSYAPPAGDNGVGEVSLVVYLSVLTISALVAIAFFAWEAMPRRVDDAMPAG